LKRKQVLKLLSTNMPAFSAMGVRSLALFGSTARDEAGPLSDVDILVEFAGPATFDGYMELKLRLEDLLGCRIDLVTRQALRPAMRPYVESEAVYVT